MKPAVLVACAVVTVAIVLLAYVSTALSITGYWTSPPEGFHQIIGGRLFTTVDMYGAEHGVGYPLRVWPGWVVAELPQRAVSGWLVPGGDRIMWEDENVWFRQRGAGQN